MLAAKTGHTRLLTRRENKPRTRWGPQCLLLLACCCYAAHSVRFLLFRAKPIPARPMPSKAKMEGSGTDVDDTPVPVNGTKSRLFGGSALLSIRIEAVCSPSESGVNRTSMSKKEPENNVTEGGTETIGVTPSRRNPSIKNDELESPVNAIWLTVNGTGPVEVILIFFVSEVASSLSPKSQLDGSTAIF